MSETFPSFDELLQSFSALRRANGLHPLTEKRLASILRNIYPDEHPVPEPAEIPGGRSDLAFYFRSGRYVVFEVFATVSQVADDLRHLEQSNAHARIAILTDPPLDDGKIFEAYFRKRPRDPFPWVKLSDVLVAENEAMVKEQLRQHIDAAFAASMDVGTTSHPELQLELFQMDRMGAYTDGIALEPISQVVPFTLQFGLALQNQAASAVVEGIGIKLELWWGGGEHLRGKAPMFEAPLVARGWETQHRFLINERPAVLLFSDPNLMCFPKQPKEWAGFRLTLYERWNGWLHLLCLVSSARPYAESRGALTIAVSS